MKRRLIVIATVCGGLIGTLIGYWISHTWIADLIVMFLAFAGFFFLAAIMIAVLFDMNKKQPTKSYPANWGFDKRYE